MLRNFWTFWTKQILGLFFYNFLVLFFDIIVDYMTLYFGIISQHFFLTLIFDVLMLSFNFFLLLLLFIDLFHLNKWNMIQFVNRSQKYSSFLDQIWHFGHSERPGGLLRSRSTQNLHWKLGRLTPSFGSILVVRLKFYFFMNKTFLFFKIEKQLLFSFFLSVVWLSWNFVRFHEILFQTDTESFSSLSWKTKKFYS